MHKTQLSLYFRRHIVQVMSKAELGTCNFVALARAASFQEICGNACIAIILASFKVQL